MTYAKGALVQGTGGVSLFALQIANATGARVIVISGSDAKLERVRKLGAAHVINRMITPNWPQAVKDLTAGRGADHVLEMVGGENLNRSLEALAPSGRVSVIGVLEPSITISAAFPCFAIRRRCKASSSVRAARWKTSCTRSITCG
jgi:NADPH:quinone reductase-like Zn-dependent oxidoreductase